MLPAGKRRQVTKPTHASTFVRTPAQVALIPEAEVRHARRAETQDVERFWLLLEHSRAFRKYLKSLSRCC